ncbi:hypothetical protein KC347_g276 [Hortaea werneckii]|nr:hypothetical protein KC347_g276 [Hortaea werneckii]
MAQRHACRNHISPGAEELLVRRADSAMRNGLKIRRMLSCETGEWRYCRWRAAGKETCFCSRYAAMVELLQSVRAAVIHTSHITLDDVGHTCKTRNERLIECQSNSSCNILVGTSHVPFVKVQTPHRHPSLLELLHVSRVRPSQVTLIVGTEQLSPGLPLRQRTGANCASWCCSWLLKPRRPDRKRRLKIHCVILQMNNAGSTTHPSLVCLDELDACFSAALRSTPR